MEYKVLLTVFAAVFVAELGDKTQLAVICMTAKTRQPFPVFLGAVLALIIVTLLAAVFGEALASSYPSPSSDAQPRASPNASSGILGACKRCRSPGFRLSRHSRQRLGSFVKPRSA